MYLWRAIDISYSQDGLRVYFLLPFRHPPPGHRSLILTGITTLVYSVIQKVIFATHRLALNELLSTVCLQAMIFFFNQGLKRILGARFCNAPDIIAVVHDDYTPTCGTYATLLSTTYKNGITSI